MRGGDHLPVSFRKIFPLVNTIISRTWVPSKYVKRVDEVRCLALTHLILTHLALNDVPPPLPGGRPGFR